MMERNLAVEENPQMTAMMRKVKENLKEYQFAYGPEAFDGVDDAGTNDGVARKMTYAVMTDDKAPVELLGMQVIDELIGDEVSYYKKIYKESGLKGLLKALEF